MKVNMRNVYVLCGVILITVLVAYCLFSKNKLEMFNTLNGARNEARMNEEIQNYFLRGPRLSLSRAEREQHLPSENQVN